MGTELTPRTQHSPLAERRPTSVAERLASQRDRFMRGLRARISPDIDIKDTLMRNGVAQLASGGVSFSFGYLSARKPEWMRMGPMPTELLAGVVLHGVALIASPKAAPHLLAAGTGALDSFLNSLGRGLGRQARKSAGLPPAPESLLSGEDGEVTGGGALSDEELARLARRI